LAVDSLSIFTNIITSDNTSKNNLAVTGERKELILDLEKKFYSITKGASSLAYFNYLKNMACTNLQNANILYDFIITENNYTNVKLFTR
jgi:hypothetical protein